ncbi:sulfotransferase 1C4-like isoform X2 [Anthonomus grandis grandis]|uniref:sulfotransferase 1C4-like isoform X2 n=1 Tax=Anthonomus grandis grandis TaxID=2921223 RepID=UPI002166AD26|nr:sulfotransferase 1C4-like isoform X2 [Anthonomus grandis grandis]
MSKQEGKGQENQQQEELLKFPYEIKELEADLNSKLLQTFLGERTGGYVQVGYKNWFLPKKYKQDAKFYYNFKVRSDDVFVVTFPRSGTTWTQEMVWLLSNRLDYKTAKETPLNHRYTFLEFYSLNTDEGFVNLLGRKVTPSWIGLGQESLGKRRFIKSHLPLELLPPDLLCSRAKVVYVARNPKDVVVSYYHFAKANPFYGFDGEFGEFWELFRQNLIHWAPYWEHVKEAWTRRRGNENFLFIFYEDMIKDLKETVNKVSIFLGQSYSSEQLDQLSKTKRGRQQ